MAAAAAVVHVTPNVSTGVPPPPVTPPPSNRQIGTMLPHSERASFLSPPPSSSSFPPHTAPHYTARKPHTVEKLEYKDAVALTPDSSCNQTMFRICAWVGFLTTIFGIFLFLGSYYCAPGSVGTSMGAMTPTFEAIGRTTASWAVTLGTDAITLSSTIMAVAGAGFLTGFFGGILDDYRREQHRKLQIIQQDRDNFALQQQKKQPPRAAQMMGQPLFAGNHLDEPVTQSQFFHFSFEVRTQLNAIAEHLRIPLPGQMMAPPSPTAGQPSMMPVSALPQRYQPQLRRPTDEDHSMPQVVVSTVATPSAMTSASNVTTAAGSTTSNLQPPLQLLPRPASLPPPQTSSNVQPPQSSAVAIDVNSVLQPPSQSAAQSASASTSAVNPALQAQSQSAVVSTTTPAAAVPPSTTVPPANATTDVPPPPEE